MKKSSKLYSVFFQKCPRCHEGDLFTNRNPYKLGKIFDMPRNCNHCGQIYQLEPSFFYGAMYVNYGLTVGIGIATFGLMKLFGPWQLHHYLVGIIMVLILSAPITFRLGRSIWINMFVKYDPKAAKKS